MDIKPPSSKFLDWDESPDTPPVKDLASEINLFLSDEIESLRGVPQPPYDAPLSEHRRWLQANVVDGVHCTECDQWAKITSRRLTVSMAIGLMVMCRWHSENGWHRYMHIPTVTETVRGANTNNDLALTRHWGMIEAEPENYVTDDGNPHGKGVWRLTAKGRSYVNREIAVPMKVVLDWCGRFVRLEGQPWPIEDALGSKFDYREIMAPTEGSRPSDG